MNKDINVAEILKTKEKGTKLYDIVRDIDVYLYNIVGENDEIHCSLEKDGCKILAYSYNGTLPGFVNGMMVLVPSREMQDWEKFQWKKGDILRHNTYAIVVMFDSFINDDYTKFKFNYKLGPEQYDMSSDLTERFTKVSEQETKSYITQIEIEYNVKFNNEISEFEKTPAESKDGDVEKKQIVDLKLKIRFKPFDKVVVFDELAKKWECGMFSHYSKNYEGKEVITCIGGCTYFKVLPFNEETAKLIGTTKDMEI